MTKVMIMLPNTLKYSACHTYDRGDAADDKEDDGDVDDDD